MTDTINLALAGDVMLGRLVNETVRHRGFAYPWGNMIRVLNEADLFLLNLECAITAHSHRWRDGEKEFYFRADPTAIETLRLGGVDFASLANNHAGDFGDEGLLETVRLLDGAGIKHAGAGADLSAARAPARLVSHGLRVAVVSFADHPQEWVATASSPGINYTGVPATEAAFRHVQNAVSEARRSADLVIFSIHWGPNMNERPLKGFPEFAHAVIDSGADVFWGHSAHVVQGMEIWHGRPILYDTGDLVDDYAVDPRLRNDLGALFRLAIRGGSVQSIEVLPTRIDAMQVNHARGPEREWFLQRFAKLCREMGTDVSETEAGARITPAETGAGKERR